MAVPLAHWPVAFSLLATIAPASQVGAPREIAPNSPPSRLNGHEVRLDGEGRLLPWNTAESPYAETARLAWEAFLTRFPVLENGQRTYITYSRFDPNDLQGIPWPHNPAGLYAMLTDSALLYYGYSGDSRVMTTVGSLLDYQLVHGTTPIDWDWGRVPFASATAGETEYTGGDDAWCDGCGRGDGTGVLEPDKVAELGLAYLKYFEATGQTRFRDESIACADALARHVRPGSEAHSPWPFRVDGKTGREKDPYTANMLPAVELFDELNRLELGSGGRYARARAMAWRWLQQFPMENDFWSGYFEDISPEDGPDENPNQYIPSQMAEYLLNHPMGPAEKRDVTHLIRWIRQNFAGDTETERGMQHGAEVLSEQRADMAKMGSHTARYAALMALYFERTGDTHAIEKAYRSFNWASYMESEDGIVTVGEDKAEGYWFSDGYGDYIRHFMKGIASYPEWAPADENHLLRTSSVIRHVEYSESQLRYETFDGDSEDRIVLAHPPEEIAVGGLPIEETSAQARISHLETGAVLVDLSRTSPGEVVISF